MSLVFSKFLQRLFWNRKMRSVTLHSMRFLPIRQGRVMCLCWNGARYGCNPKAISDAIVSQREWREKFEVWFAFKEPYLYLQLLPHAVRAVEIGSFQYYYLLATSNFIISNIHCPDIFFPYKGSKQKYIFTGHGGSGIKKIEFDTDSLPVDYQLMARADTLRINLFLSGSSFRSKVIRSAYRYSGEILEEGTPRNDQYLQELSKQSNQLVTSGVRYLIYAPTFRKNGSRDCYGFDVDKVVTALEERFGGEWYVRVSSHPNMANYYREIYDFSHPRLLDVGQEELQPLLVSSDILVTDYSSAEMDFILRATETQRFRPVFQLCKDRQDYDRGFYINPEQMPFPYAETDEQLVLNILSFDEDKYQRDLELFNKEVVNPKETGHAATSVVEWMLENMKA